MPGSICPGCGLERPSSPGPTHSYVVSSPECWAVFTRTSTEIRERLLPDAYMAQHPDGDAPQQTQSVAVHLVTLNAVLRRGISRSDASRVTAAAVDAGRNGVGYPVLAAKPTWGVTIAEVAGGSVPAADYAELVLDSWLAGAADEIDRWTTRAIGLVYGS